MPTKFKPASGGTRVELGRSKLADPGEIKFTRNPDGTIAVTGNPDPKFVAMAITRSKKRRAEGRAPIGAERAAKLKARLRRKLEGLG